MLDVAQELKGVVRFREVGDRCVAIDSDSTGRVACGAPVGLVWHIGVNADGQHMLVIGRRVIGRRVVEASARAA